MLKHNSVLEMSTEMKGRDRSRPGLEFDEKNIVVTRVVCNGSSFSLHFAMKTVANASNADFFACLS